MKYKFDDTIVALATAEGASGLGVIRVSGKDAFKITDKVFRSKEKVRITLGKADSHTIHYGTIGNEKVLDEVMVSVFRNPRSYTREDVIEISCHGSGYIQQQIIQLLIDKGARLAKPGEFTLRAFINGRIDLSEAEAVADLIAASSEEAHDLALKQMRGGFSDEISKMREKLVHFASMVELELDFSEEDVEFANKQELEELVNEIKGYLQKLIQSFAYGNVIKNGIATVIAGRPNAGKSTLLNALLKEDRAIVSDIPGTTRDSIEEVVVIEGKPFRFIDTAGIREARDTIESMGVERTFKQIEQAAIVLYIFDVTEISAKELEEDIKQLKADGVELLLIGNKIDLDEKQNYKQQFGSNGNSHFVSAKLDQHIDELTKKLSSLAITSAGEKGSVVVTNARHYEALVKSDEALTAVIKGLAAHSTGDILALDIRHALHYLGEITGEITTDDLLDEIFSKFCIGK
ncbi:MAG: tRNA uridine-5-carboxymethylaminomethyl(34) synthesis GTPase MnmE [Bacteroidetes bacterium]|nr:tRNA uridine-5-carboxymethylaminomethyl(34) synthesis GTPase MnmE [Bacteroidota bacterium]